MNLKLDKPIVFFDFETTGVNLQNDRVIEYCFTKIMPDYSRITLSGLINPEMPISQEAFSIHGISDEKVQNAPTFTQKAKEFCDFLQDCDLAGFNIINFDVPMLVQELKRAGFEFKTDDVKFVDSQKIFFKKEPRTLSAALKFYCNKNHENAHGADADVNATIDVLNAQLELYNDLPKTTEELHSYCRECNPLWLEPSGRIRWIDGEAGIGFKSNFEQKKLSEIVQNPKGKMFLKWIINNNFSHEVKQICQDALEGKFYKKNADN